MPNTDIVKEEDIFGQTLEVDTPLFKNLTLKSGQVEAQFEDFQLKSIKLSDSELGEEDDEWNQVDISDKIKKTHLEAIKATQTYFTQYAGFEFQAHHLAYQDLAHNTIIKVLETDGTSGDYIVHRLTNMQGVEGLKGHVLIPKNPKAFGNDIKVIFRGTASASGAHRDIFETNGAGTETFEAERENFIAQINTIVKDFNANNNKNRGPISLTVAGHSLGGADAQNCTAALMDAIAQNNGLHSDVVVPEPKRSALTAISTLRVFTKNSAGITLKTANRTNDVAAYLAKCRSTGQTDLTIESYNLQVHGDVVQQTGEAHLLSNVSSELAKVDVMKADLSVHTPLHVKGYTAAGIAGLSGFAACGLQGAMAAGSVGATIGSVAGPVGTVLAGGALGLAGAALGTTVGIIPLVVGILPVAYHENIVHRAKFFNVNKPMQATCERLSNEALEGQQKVSATLGYKSQSIGNLQSTVVNTLKAAQGYFNAWNSQKKPTYPLMTPAVTPIAVITTPSQKRSWWSW